MSTARCDPAVLEELALFHDVTRDDAQRLSELLHQRTFPAGTHIVFHGQPGEAVYVVLEGTVKIRVTLPDGKEVILAILGRGEVVGEMSVVDSLGRSATATAMEPTTLVSMDKERFWQCLRTMPALTYNLARILSRRLRLANVQMQALAGLDVESRLARQVVAFANEYGEDIGDGAVRIPIRLTQSDLAGLIGASRVRVNQVLSGYRRLGLVSVDHGHRIVVHDAGELARRCP